MLSVVFITGASTKTNLHNDLNYSDPGVNIMGLFQLEKHSSVVVAIHH